MAETILIVDDEDSVRRTFRDWLVEANLNATILVADGAEAALLHAQKSPIDLAVLDWNLGTGSDGLQLLEDLCVFHADIVAILVTGYAHQATPLVALRMGVRDYLDKSADLNRDTFVGAVKKQLAKIGPAKKLRQWHESLATFRSSVEQVLPLVRSSSALSEPVPLPAAVSALCEFLRHVTGAADAVLLVRILRDGDEKCLAYAADGSPIAGPLARFDKSLAATALSLGEPSIIAALSDESLGGVELQPFERNRKSLLAAPLAVGAGVAAVLELFDNSQGFTPEHRRLAGAAAAVGSALLQQTISHRQKDQATISAIETLLNDAAGMAPMDTGKSTQLPDTVRASLRAGLDSPGSAIRGAAALDFAEAVQNLASRHGEPAVRHCLRLVQEVSRLLDESTGESLSSRPAR